MYGGRMVTSPKISQLIPLVEQIDRDDNDVIAIRQHQALYAIDFKKYIASLYQQIKLSPATHWAIAMQDSFYFVVSLFAILYAGKQPVLLNPRQKEMTSFYQALVTDHLTPECMPLTLDHLINIHHLNTDTVIDNLSSILPATFVSDSLTIFTSGSTGLPKPVSKTIAQLETESQILTNQFTPLSDLVFIASVSHEHMYGLTFKIVLALMNQAPFICETISYQEQLASYRYRNILYITTPSILKMLDANIAPISCNKVISAGGLLTFQTANLCLKCFNRLPNEIYGSTETGIIATRSQYQSETPWQLFAPMKLTSHHENEQVVLHSPLITQPEILNDKVAIIDDQHFYLQGRTDKIVKISEKRVSLTYIEQQLEILNEITHATIIPLEQKNRTILAAAIILSQIGQEKLQQLGHFQLTQYFRQRLKDKLSLVTVPKKWRFVKQLPVNQQGKSTYIEIKALFENPELIMKKLPKELNISVNDNTAELELIVPNDLFWFNGHFPTQPLLPGVVQLNWVIHYSEILFAQKFNIQSLEIIKFQMPILPNDTLILHINWLKEFNKLQFTYTVANKTASSGKIKLCQ